jgi:hypothetical protein
VNLTTKDGTVVVDGKQATTFTANTFRGRTSISTQSGLAELHSGSTVKQIAAGESAMAGTPNPQAKDDDEGGMSGGALAVLLLAVGGAVAAVIWAATHNNDFINSAVVRLLSLAQRSKSGRVSSINTWRWLQCYGHINETLRVTRRRVVLDPRFWCR